MNSTETISSDTADIREELIDATAADVAAQASALSGAEVPPTDVLVTARTPMTADDNGLLVRGAWVRLAGGCVQIVTAVRKQRWAGANVQTTTAPLTNVASVTEFNGVAIITLADGTKCTVLRDQAVGVRDAMTAT